MQEKESNKGMKILIIILLVIIIGLVGYIFIGNNKKDDSKKIDESQSSYVKPETPTDRSKNVTMPGWVSFTIPANTKTITHGFEFHNPDKNYWYEDEISIKGNKIENLVVDSGNKVDLNHYLGSANIDGKVKKVLSYDKKYFSIINTDDVYKVEGIGYFKGKKSIKVETSSGEKVNIDMKCHSNCFYMSFGLYLSKGDELLYQSSLVSPGKYIQKMEMNRSLKPGTYKAYVLCQPYKSDKKTETNRGKIEITLTVK